MMECKKRVMPNGSYRTRQCSRKAVKDGYCKQHHPDTIKARQEASTKRYEEQRAKSPWALLKRAKERIAVLELQIEKLNTRHISIDRRYFDEGLEAAAKYTDSLNLDQTAEAIRALKKKED